MGWSRSRRVILLRRRLRGLSSWPIRPVKGGQLQLGLVEIGTDRQLWEYGALVTSLDAEIITLGQLYRDRGYRENAFDEIKNQWGWGWLHDPRSGALPADGPHRGAGLQLVDVVRPTGRPRSPS